jgi:SAM-dependent MidA family methyltransferase
VEIGAEPGGDGLLSGVPHPFAGVTALRLGDDITLTGECVVFSNELFDAQPFVRTRFRSGAWRTMGVRFDGQRFFEVEMPVTIAGPPAPEGYCFDRPQAAADLAETIARQPWSGLFVAFDYGKTLRELVTETPAGTARAYRLHRQVRDLLAEPGEQDLTCHICWDWMEEALRRHGFAAPEIEFQESFLIRHAAASIARATQADAATMSRRKLALLQLLHPAHLGQKFQVLHALR